MGEIVIRLGNTRKQTYTKLPAKPSTVSSPGALTGKAKRDEFMAGLWAYLEIAQRRSQTDNMLTGHEELFMPAHAVQKLIALNLLKTKVELATTVTKRMTRGVKLLSHYLTKHEVFGRMSAIHGFRRSVREAADYMLLQTFHDKAVHQIQDSVPAFAHILITGDCHRYTVMWNNRIPVRASADCAAKTAPDSAGRKPAHTNKPVTTDVRTPKPATRPRSKSAERRDATTPRNQPHSQAVHYAKVVQDDGRQHVHKRDSSRDARTKSPGGTRSNSSHRLTPATRTAFETPSSLTTRTVRYADDSPVATLQQRTPRRHADLPHLSGSQMQDFNLRVNMQDARMDAVIDYGVTVRKALQLINIPKEQLTHDERYILRQMKVHLAQIADITPHKASQDTTKLNVISFTDIQSFENTCPLCAVPEQECRCCIQPEDIFKVLVAMCKTNYDALNFHTDDMAALAACTRNLGIIEPKYDFALLGAGAEAQIVHVYAKRYLSERAKWQRLDSSCDDAHHGQTQASYVRALKRFTYIMGLWAGLCRTHTYTKSETIFMQAYVLHVEQPANGHMLQHFNNALTHLEITLYGRVLAERADTTSPPAEPVKLNMMRFANPVEPVILSMDTCVNDADDETPTTPKPPPYERFDTSEWAGCQLVSLLLTETVPASLESDLKLRELMFTSEPETLPISDDHQDEAKQLLMRLVEKAILAMQTQINSTFVQRCHDMSETSVSLLRYALRLLKLCRLPFSELEQQLYTCLQQFFDGHGEDLTGDTHSSYIWQCVEHYNNVVRGGRSSTSSSTSAEEVDNDIDTYLGIQPQQPRDFSPESMRALSQTHPDVLWKMARMLSNEVINNDCREEDMLELASELEVLREGIFNMSNLQPAPANRPALRHMTDMIDAFIAHIDGAVKPWSAQDKILLHRHVLSVAYGTHHSEPAYLNAITTEDQSTAVTFSHDRYEEYAAQLHQLEQQLEESSLSPNAVTQPIHGTTLMRDALQRDLIKDLSASETAMVRELINRCNTVIHALVELSRQADMQPMSVERPAYSLMHIQDGSSSEGELIDDRLSVTSRGSSSSRTSIRDSNIIILNKKLTSLIQKVPFPATERALDIRLRVKPDTGKTAYYVKESHFNAALPLIKQKLTDSEFAYLSAAVSKCNARTTYTVLEALLEASPLDEDEEEPAAVTPATQPRARNTATRFDDDDAHQAGAPASQKSPAAAPHTMSVISPISHKFGQEHLPTSNTMWVQTPRMVGPSQPHQRQSLTTSGMYEDALISAMNQSAYIDADKSDTTDFHPILRMCMQNDWLKLNSWEIYQKLQSSERAHIHQTATTSEPTFHKSLQIFISAHAVLDYNKLITHDLSGMHIPDPYHVWHKLDQARSFSQRFGYEYLFDCNIYAPPDKARQANVTLVKMYIGAQLHRHLDLYNHFMQTWLKNFDGAKDFIHCITYGNMFTGCLYMTYLYKQLIHNYFTNEEDSPDTYFITQLRNSSLLTHSLTDFLSKLQNQYKLHLYLTAKPTETQYNTFCKILHREFMKHPDTMENRISYDWRDHIQPDYREGLNMAPYFDPFLFLLYNIRERMVFYPNLPTACLLYGNRREQKKRNTHVNFVETEPQND